MRKILQALAALLGAGAVVATVVTAASAVTIDTPAVQQADSLVVVVSWKPNCPTPVTCPTSYRLTLLYNGAAVLTRTVTGRADTIRGTWPAGVTSVGIGARVVGLRGADSSAAATASRTITRNLVPPPPPPDTTPAPVDTLLPPDSVRIDTIGGGGVVTPPDTIVAPPVDTTPIPPPSGAACPNEPAGYTAYGSPVTFASINAPSGWSVLGQDRVLATESGPYANTSLALKHEAGAGSSQIGIVQTTDFAQPPKSVYSCVVFKQSANYKQHPSGTKFIYTPQTGSGTRPIQFQMYPSPRNGPTFRWRMEMQSGDSQRLYDDNQATSLLSPGTWYRLEFLATMNTPGSKNGILRWWTSRWNGSGWDAPQLNADHRNVLIASAGMPATWRKWEYNVYYGGSDAVSVPADQFVLFNRIHVSTQR